VTVLVAGATLAVLELEHGGLSPPRSALLVARATDVSPSVRIDA